MISQKPIALNAYYILILKLNNYDKNDIYFEIVQIKFFARIISFSEVDLYTCCVHLIQK